MTYIAAASAAASDIQTAHDAASAGDIILVPAGTPTYTTGTANTPSLSITKAVTIRGAGATKTVITNGCDGGFDEVPIKVSGVTAGLVRITGVGFAGDGTGGFGFIFVTGVNSSGRFILDHIDFAGTIISRSVVCTNSFGLIHDLTVNETDGIADGQILVVGNNEASWTLDPPWGTDEQVVIEDCSLNSDGSALVLIDNQTAASYTVRHSTIVGGAIAGHGLDSNPPNIRGARTVEIYNNTIIGVTGQYTAIQLRSGSGRVFNNSISGTFSGPKLELAHYRAETVATSIYDSDWGRCEGTNPIDGNDDATGYPGRDQIGRVKDAFEWDASTPFAGPYPSQTLDPVYQWNNGSLTWSINDQGSTSPSQADHIQEGRDYYDETEHPTYVPLGYPHPLRAQEVNVPTYVQSALNRQFSGASYTVALTGVASGNNVVIMVGVVDDTATPTVSSDVDGALTALGTAVTLAAGGNNPAMYGRLFILYDATAGDHTFTVTPSASVYSAAAAVEVNGADTTDCISAITGQSQVDPGAATDAATSGAATPDQDNTLILGFCWSPAGANVSSGTGFTGDESGSWFGVEHLAQGTAASIAATFTLASAFDDPVTFMVALKATTPTYTVTYDGNAEDSGTAPTDGSSPYEESDTVTVLGNTGSLAKTGYTFDGWNTAANGSGTAYDPSDTFSMPASNVTLYAQWLLNATSTNNIAATVAKTFAPRLLWRRRR